MTCKSVQSLLWETQLDDEAIAHLSECGKCEMERRQIRALRSGLRRLPVLLVPAIATTRLHVLASYSAQGELPSAVRHWWRRMGFAFADLLRPLAVPAMGGVIASLLFFGLIVDKLHYSPDWSTDIPVRLFTDVTMDEPSPLNCEGQDVTVQLDVDENGHVTDYSLPWGEVLSPGQVQEVGNLVLYTTFSPAISFGQPIRSRVMVDVHHMVVRG